MCLRWKQLAHLGDHGRVPRLTTEKTTVPLGFPRSKCQPERAKQRRRQRRAGAGAMAVWSPAQTRSCGGRDQRERCGERSDQRECERAEVVRPVNTRATGRER